MSAGQNGSSPQAAGPETPDRLEAPRGRLLRKLGLYGLDHLEAVFIAALATESPLLLVGPHGTAKSRLLLRLAEALGLPSRHYNASLLSFDDLVGYPLPDERGELRFVRTPASIWEAGVVFLDELSRCRPDVQNRVFSIIHERRVQGIALPDLRHRWAAMNPAPEDGSDAANDYLGAQPLDAALADRFPFIVVMPDWGALTDAEKTSVILADDRDVPEAVASELREAVQATRDRLEDLRPIAQDQAAAYVRLLLPLLGEAGILLSPRRANMLLRNALAVQAAARTLSPWTTASAATWLAVQWSLPQRAQGGAAISSAKLLVAHRLAWESSGLDALHPLRLLNAERDPIQRAVLALSLPDIPPAEISAHVADGLASAPDGARHALALRLMHLPGAARLHVAVAAQLAELAKAVLVGQDVDIQTHSGQPHDVIWKAIAQALAERCAEDDRVPVGNLLTSLLANRRLTSKEDVERALTAFLATRERLAREEAP